MRVIVKFLITTALLLTSLPLTVWAGEGNLKLGYVYLDEDGNKSVYNSSFNLYEGAALSLERFRHDFQNGLHLTANLQNITLNNRNLAVGLNKYGQFGIQVHHEKYRRPYSFAGDASTVRHRTGGTVWFYPQRFVKIFAGGDFTHKEGDDLSYFAGTSGLPMSFKYNQVTYKGGVQLNYYGRMLRAEYSGANFTDDLRENRDLQRSTVRLLAQMPVPRYEWVILSGGFQHFENKRKDTDFKFSANTVWGSALAKFPAGFSAKYAFKLDRASSDSDLVATDNLLSAVYVSYDRVGIVRLTAGYQYGANDDLEDKVQSNSMYLSGWVQPVTALQFQGEVGVRAEDVKEGSRLLGDEDWNRYKYGATVKDASIGSLTLSGESKRRKNDDIGDKVDFDRYAADGRIFAGKNASMNLPLVRKATLKSLSAGYSYTKGKYTNPEQQFEFADHIVYGEVKVSLSDKFIAGHRFTYYRSQKDLDVESFKLRFSGEYLLTDDFGIEVIYRVQNFDDYTVRLPYDQYYTANIVEVNISKGLKF